jgi:hypothetical protein
MTFRDARALHADLGGQDAIHVDGPVWPDSPGSTGIRGQGDSAPRIRHTVGDTSLNGSSILGKDIGVSGESARRSAVRQQQWQQRVAQLLGNLDNLPVQCRFVVQGAHDVADGRLALSRRDQNGQRS